MSEAEIIDLLIKYREHLTIANLLNAPFRVLAWLIISGLAVCADALSGGLKEVYKLMNFFNSDQINDFIDDYIAIILALASLAFAWLGWKIIVLNQTDLNKVVTNTLVAVTLFVVLPWAMVQAEKLTSAGVKHLDGDISTSTKIISSNITDLYVIDDGNWKKLNPKPGNYIKDDENVSFIDITETVDTGGFWSTSPLSDKGVKILEKKVNDSSGEYTLEKLKSHFFTDDEAYYRYSWNPIFIMIELATVCLVFIFTIFKTTQLIIELGVLKILTQATALTDVETGQRNKKLIEKIRNTFIILYIIMLLLNIYLLFVDYISTTTISDPVKLLVILAAAFLVIDGPNFIEELFGIDAGLRSASRTILGLLGAAKGAQMATSAVGKGLKTAGKALKTGAKGTGKLLGAAGTIGAGAKGALDGYKENKNNNSGNRGTGGSSLLNANGNQNVDSKENNSSRQENNRNDATPLESQNQQNNDSVESLQTGNESPSQNGSPTVTMTEGNTPLGGAKDKQQRNSNSSNFNANGSGSHLRREESQNTNQPSGMFRANEMGNTPLGNPESNNSGNQMQNNSAPNVNDVNVGGGHTLGNGFNANNGNTPLGDNGIQKSGGKGSQGIPIKGVGSNSGNTGPIGNLGGTQQGTPISGVGSNSGSTGPIGNLGGTQQGTPISGVGSNSGSTGPIGNLGGTQQGTPIKGVGSNSGNTGPIGNLGGTQQGTSIKGVGSNSGSTGPVGNLGGTQQGTPIKGVGSNNGSTGTLGNLGGSQQGFPTSSGLGLQNTVINPSIASPIRGSIKPNMNVPRSVNVPSYVSAAKQQFNNSIQQTPVTSQTIGETAIEKYADTTQKVYDSKPIQNMRKAYDMSKNSVIKRNDDK